jgi:N-methylhydantoinase A/oxoprolinase/acetone carboxylase beta subunit
MKRIGIDVGGTNTDAVLIDSTTVLGAVKSPTTADVMSGVVKSMEHLVQNHADEVRDLDAVMIGTTHFTNAVVERARLDRVAANPSRYAGISLAAAYGRLASRPA